ncbi:MAG: hydantoinase/oxoprolinase family protein, partial [Planctomycetota bacterium]
MTFSLLHGNRDVQSSSSGRQEAVVSAKIVQHDGATGRLCLSPAIHRSAFPRAADDSEVYSCAFEALSNEEAPVLAARLVTRTPANAPLPDHLHLRLATTRGTNALLERRGARVAFFVTRGFRDLLLIGNQQRPDLFTLNIIKPRPLYDQVIEVPERIDHHGRVLEPLDHDEVIGRIAQARADGVTVAAIALINAWRNPIHEQELGRVLLGHGFDFVAASAELAPRIGLLARAQTAVVDAYLTPLLKSYVRRIQTAVHSAKLTPPPASASSSSPDASGNASDANSRVESLSSMSRHSRIHLMTSAGGLVSTSAFRPKDSLLSGPAGGVAGAAAAGRRSGLSRVIGFDMGGTSTDVSRYDHAFEYQFEHAVGDARLLAPALAIETVAAGGGSIGWFDGHRLRIGPQSAGAHPGPACYGAGGPLTLTDVNLLLGHLHPGRFAVPVDIDAAVAALVDLMIAVELGQRSEPTPASNSSASNRADPSHGSSLRHEIYKQRTTVLERPNFADDARRLLQGLLDIANERMAAAIRRISVQKGDDPARYALVAFGGAGGQHACAVAERLNMQTVIVPEDAGLLSAVGLQHAEMERFAERQVLRPLSKLLDNINRELQPLLQDLETEARDAVQRENTHTGSVDCISIRRRIASLRLQGQETAIDIDFDDPRLLSTLFVDAYRRLYGHSPSESIEVELESLRVVASTTTPHERAAVDAETATDTIAVASWSAPQANTAATDAWTNSSSQFKDHPVLSALSRRLPVFDRHELAYHATEGSPATSHVQMSTDSDTDHRDTGNTAIPGPALIAEAHALTVVQAGWIASLDSAGAIVLRRHGSAAATPGTGTTDDSRNQPELKSQLPAVADRAQEAIEIELFTNRFRTIAEQTGDVLRRTALSTNVKERLDFSCAVLDADGQLVVNAPHIPVHLGALGLCVRRVIQRFGSFQPGDVLVTNHPGFGGSHLPDVTIITPVFADASRDQRLEQSSVAEPAATLSSPQPSLL